MKKRVMKKKVTGKKYQVFKGLKEKTVGGLKKTDLKKNKQGKVVSKSRSDNAKKAKSYKRIMEWAKCVQVARKSLGLKGFIAVGGKSPQGQALLKKTRSL